MLGADVMQNGLMTEEDFSYVCSTCGKEHAGAPDLAFDEPWHYHVLSASERKGAELTSDTCAIDDDRFVRGVLLVPVHGWQEAFGLGVWVSLSAKSYGEFLDAYNADETPAVGPWFGWLCNRIPGYPDTLSLKASVVPQGSRLRPHIALEPTEHLLSHEQQRGISASRLAQILEANEHPPASA